MCRTEIEQRFNWAESEIIKRRVVDVNIAKTLSLLWLGKHVASLYSSAQEEEKQETEEIKLHREFLHRTTLPACLNQADFQWKHRVQCQSESDKFKIESINMNCILDLYV